MIPVAHRGMWKTREEQNTESAFRRSFDAGFGVETDLRDLAGSLVVSHDPPCNGAMPARRLLELHASSNPSLPLALNIKADGLYAAVMALIEEFGVCNYFVFDMSVPDTLGYFKHGSRVFARQSEYEDPSRLFDRAAGVWLDCFDGDWIGEEIVAGHAAAKRDVCIVSPELHRRDHIAAWTRFRTWNPSLMRSVMLCTDHPDEARAFFK